VSFNIIMTTGVTRSCFTTQHQTCKTKTTVCKTKTKNDYFGLKTSLVLRPMVSDHITEVIPGRRIFVISCQSPTPACSNAG